MVLSHLNYFYFYNFSRLLEVANKFNSHQLILWIQKTKMSWQAGAIKYHEHVKLNGAVAYICWDCVHSDKLLYGLHHRSTKLVFPGSTTYLSLFHPAKHASVWFISGSYRPAVLDLGCNSCLNVEPGAIWEAVRCSASPFPASPAQHGSPAWPGCICYPFLYVLHALVSQISLGDLYLSSWIYWWMCVYLRI